MTRKSVYKTADPDPHRIPPAPIFLNATTRKRESVEERDAAYSKEYAPPLKKSKIETSVDVNNEEDQDALDVLVPDYVNEFGDIFTRSDDQEAEAGELERPSVRSPPNGPDEPDEPNNADSSQEIAVPSSRFQSALEALALAFPSHEQEIRGFLSVASLNSTQKQTIEDSWQQKWNMFCVNEPVLSRKAQIDLCRPTGNLCADVLVELNHPTHQCEKKPGTTLDKTCASTRVLIEKGVTPQNSFVFDSYNRRCNIRRVKEFGVLRHTIATEPSTWSAELQAVHHDLSDFVWRESPAKVVIIAGKENKQSLVERLGLGP